MTQTPSPSKDYRPEPTRLEPPSATVGIEPGSSSDAKASGGETKPAEKPVLPAPPPPPSAIEVTALNYFSATTSKRLRSRMQRSAALSQDNAAPAARPGLGQRWANLSMRSKLLTLMIISAAVPTLTVTQGLVSLNRDRAIADAKQFTEQQAGAFRDEYVLWAETDATARASNLSRLVAASGIDPSALAPNRLDPSGEPVAGDKRQLQKLITLDPFTDPETSMSFQIVVDIKGRSIAQDIRLLSGEATVFDDLDQALAAVETLPVTAPLGQDLRSFPMVQQVLSNGVAASGIESISAELTEALRLSPQLKLADRLVSREGRSLAAVSISPVLLDGRTRGAVITGQLLNNNFILADAFKLRYDVSTAAVFDRDQLIVSTDPGDDGLARQTELQPSDAAIAAVLEQGEEYIEIEQRDGYSYLNYYSPIYDHSAADDATAEPVGMTYLGQSLQMVETRFRTQQLWAYALGGGMILLSTLLALPAASSLVQPLQRLSSFMGRIGRGERGLRLVDANRSDEVGQLSLSMNQMAESLDEKETRLQQELWINRVLSQIANLRSLDSHSLTEGLETSLEEVRLKLKVDRLVIYRCGTISKTGRTLYEAQRPGLPSAVELQVSDRCIPAALLEDYRQGNYKANPDVSKAGFGPEHLALLDSLQVKASLIIPVYGKDQLYGLMVAHNCQAPQNWSPAEIELMQIIADQAAATLGYVTLLEQQTEAEEKIRYDKETLQRRALELLQEVDPVSRGDLTVRAQVTPDEIGTIADSYNATVENLRKIVSQVQEVSSQVTGTAQSNNVAVGQLAQEALIQAEKITGSLARIEEMSQSVQQLAAQARQAQLAVTATNNTVAAGDAAMTRAVQGMATIRESVAETTQKMESLESASQRISNVIRLISGFAAQTHMLAMKASIEAARAGEEGEGFAVIADEVRGLAAQSAQATADVETVINTIQMATQDVISAMEIENEQVAKQLSLVDETRLSLTHITQASAQVNQLVGSIAETTERQTAAAEATAATISEVAALVMQTSQEASEVSESFQQLVNVSQSLQQEVERFKVS